MANALTKLTKGTISQVVSRIIDATTRAMAQAAPPSPTLLDGDASSSLIVGINGSVQAPGKSGRYFNGRHDAASFSLEDHPSREAMLNAVAGALGLTSNTLGRPMATGSDVIVHRGSVRRRNRFVETKVSKPIQVDLGTKTVPALAFADAFPAQHAQLARSVWAEAIGAMEGFRGPVSAQIKPADEQYPLSTNLQIVVRPIGAPNPPRWLHKVFEEGKTILHCSAEFMAPTADNDSDQDMFPSLVDEQNRERPRHKNIPMDVDEIRLEISGHIDTFQIINTLDRSLRQCWLDVYAEASRRVVDRFISEAGLDEFYFRSRMDQGWERGGNDSLYLSPQTKAERDQPIKFALLRNNDGKSSGYTIGDYEASRERSIKLIGVRKYLIDALKQAPAHSAALKSWRAAYNLESMGAASKQLLESILSPDASSLAMSLFGHTGLKLVETINRRLPEFDGLMRDGMMVMKVDASVVIEASKMYGPIDEAERKEAIGFFNDMREAFAKDLSPMAKALITGATPRFLGKSLSRAIPLAYRKQGLIRGDSSEAAAIAGQRLASFVNGCANDPGGPFLPGMAIMESMDCLRMVLGLKGDSPDLGDDFEAQTSIELAKTLNRFQSDRTFRRLVDVDSARAMAAMLFDCHQAHRGHSSEAVCSYLVAAGHIRQRTHSAEFVTKAGAARIQQLLAACGLPEKLKLIAARKAGAKREGVIEFSAAQQIWAAKAQAEGRSNDFDEHDYNPITPPRALTRADLADNETDSMCEAANLLFAVEVPAGLLDRSLRPPALQTSSKAGYGQILVRLSLIDDVDSTASPPKRPNARVELLEWVDPHPGAKVVDDTGNGVDLEVASVVRTISAKTNHLEHDAIMGAVLSVVPEWQHTVANGRMRTIGDKTMSVGTSTSQLIDGLMGVIKKAVTEQPALSTILINGTGAFARSIGQKEESIPKSQCTRVLRAALETSSHNAIGHLFLKGSSLWINSRGKANNESMFEAVVANGTRRQVAAAILAMTERFGQVPVEHASAGLRAALARHDPLILSDMMRLGGWDAQAVQEGVNRWHPALVHPWIGRQLAAARLSTLVLADAPAIEPADRPRERRIRL